MKRRILAAALAGTAVLACAPRAVVVPAETPPPMDVAMTPVHRAADGMIVAHARLTGWGPGPAALPAGAQAIVLEGDPAKAQLFTLRVKLPNNYVVPPHSHGAWEHVTVISGVLHLGMGDRFTMAGATELRAGSFAAIPSGMRHFVHAAGETVLQIHGMGPFTVTYANPADDPRNR
ncbi:MAG: DUF4437 domain-containing protein [Gemmatimonadaceae bacterium]